MNSVKTCRSCRQPIDAKATKCPHCHQLQGPARLVQWLPLLFMLFFLPYMWYAFSEIHDRPKEPFSEHRSQFSVVDTRMNFNDNERCPTIAVVGRVKNESDIPWKMLELEVRYYDSEGGLIDSATETIYGTVQAHDEAAFNARSGPTLPRDAYARFEVRVRDATDARED